MLRQFMAWWNSLAKKNGKLEFRTQREAAEFVRRIHNQNGGPNRKILEMRKLYQEAKSGNREHAET